MKKLVLAALLAASATSAEAAVTFKFTGTEDGGAAVSGKLTIDTDALLAANGAVPPSADYTFQTDDPQSSSLLPFLSFSFTSAGTQPVLLTGADYTYQELLGDPSGGQFLLELDYVVTHDDGTTTSSTVSLSEFGQGATKYYGGVLLPDFANLGPVFFDIKSGTGENGATDLESFGSLTFSDAVPEASTWSMLVMGFGAVGYAARRRTRVAA